MESFSKWENDGTSRAKYQNINIRFLINDDLDTINIFIRKFKNNIKYFNTKAQVCKVKPQNFQIIPRNNS